MAAAIRLMDAEGFDALSMRRIADEFGTGAAPFKVTVPLTVTVFTSNAIDPSLPPAHTPALLQE